MKTRLGGVTILRAGAALALVAALAACGGGSGTTAGVGGGQCAAGETLVGGDCLTAAQVTANTAIDAADTVARALFSAGLVNVTADDITRIDGLVTDAETAIAGLPEDERDAADDGLDEARAILQQAREVLALNNRPQPGNEQVSDSGVAALAALRAYNAAKAAEKSAHDAIKKLGNGGTSGHSLSTATVLNVKGESADAEKYADNILKAVKELADQKTAVANAVKEIEAAIAALPADTPNRATVLESLNDDLRSAQRHQTEIGKINLDGEEYRVEGQSGDRKPSAFADYVATAIDSALGSEQVRSEWLNPIAAGNRVAHHGVGTTGDVDLTDAQLKAIKDTGHMESTAPADFTPLSKTDGRFVLTGAALSLFTDNRAAPEDAVLTSADTVQAEDTAFSVTYRGLTGNLTCRVAAECDVEDGALIGPWHLAQGDLDDSDGGFTDLDGLFRLIEGVYRQFDGGYVRYGYWLSNQDTNTASRTGIVTFAVPTDLDLPNARALALTAGPAKAEYSGDALGISVLKTYSSDSENPVVTSRKSGSFTADVSLTADFTGTNAELRGRIDNFQGKAVGSGWFVTLRPANISPTDPVGSLTGERVAVGANGSGPENEGDHGQWHAQMTGGSQSAGDNPPVRPDAVHGGFAADFPNGEATGGFQATKD